MAAGKKKFTIEIQRLQAEKMPDGSIKEVYVEHLKLKAELKFNSGNVSVINDEIYGSNSITFQTYKRDIILSDIIIFQNNKYAINAINPLQYSNELVINCSLINE